jgi:hypothetical protein
MTRAKKAPAPFVMAAKTTVAASKSAMELEKILRRYGATGFSVARDYTHWRIAVSFVVPDTADGGATLVPVKIPVEVSRVYDRLYGMPKKWGTERRAPVGYNKAKMEQAERVAFRNLVLWVDAALSAATIGMQTITEALFAHAVVGDGGERMIEVVSDAQGQLALGVRRLLTSGAST